MAVNTANSHITLDEIKTIVKYYVKLHNRLYKEQWDEEAYVAVFLETFRKKRLKHL